MLLAAQDEGIKLQGEITLEVNEFKKVVDVQAEAVEGKDIVKEAELIDNKQDIEKRKGLPGKEVSGV